MITQIVLSPRVARRQEPPAMQGRRGYEAAKDSLQLDFDHRCAYCMIAEAQHTDGADGFQIDHFMPVARGGAVNDYDNLYWSCSRCNSWKHDHWPTLVEWAAGYQYVDPCLERDYGVHFVEDADGVLQPQTRSGEYHVRRIRLNRDSLVELRRVRREQARKLDDARRLLDEFRRSEALDPITAACIAKFTAIVEREAAEWARMLDVSIPPAP